MFHTGTVERLVFSIWYGREYRGEIRCFTLVLWRDYTFYTGTVERFDDPH